MEKAGYGKDSIFSLRLAANKTYHYVSFPSMRTGKPVSDRDGWLRMSMIKSSMEMFYIAPDVKSQPTQALKTRLKTIKKALSLDGRVKSPVKF